MCAELGVFDLAQSPAIPSAASIAGFDLALGEGAPPRPRRDRGDPRGGAGARPRHAGRVRRHGDARRAPPDPDERYEVYSASAPIVIRRNNLDDSVTAHGLRAPGGADRDGRFVVFANGTRAVDVCGRGTTEVDGETGCV